MHATDFVQVAAVVVATAAVMAVVVKVAAAPPPSVQANQTSLLRRKVATMRLLKNTWPLMRPALAAETNGEWALPVVFL